MNSGPGILTVSALNELIKSRLESDPAFKALYVSGEISDFKAHGSGHCYFTLKDENCSIKCFMHAKCAKKLGFLPADGLTVIASGKIAGYAREGKYHLYCIKLTPEGPGALYLAFEQLKSRLAAEGLFDQKAKKTLPAYPRRIALISSPTGAAVQDMLRILGARWPVAKVIILPVLVQGDGAPSEIVHALSLLSNYRFADVAILGRGGGQLEDLQAFNNEQVARAIFACSVPVVSAVGHESDVTIADFVADVRAATPTHAAQLVSPDILELTIYLTDSRSRLNAASSALLAGLRDSLASLASRRVLSSPSDSFLPKKAAFELMRERLKREAGRYMASRRESMLELTSKLSALSPLEVLSRGYSIASTDAGIITHTSQVSVGDELSLKLSDGGLLCEVRELRCGTHGTDDNI